MAGHGAVALPMIESQNAPFERFLENVDIAVTATERVALRQGRRFVTRAGASTVVYVVEGELRGESMASCEVDRELPGAVRVALAPGRGRAVSGSALVTLGATPLVLDAERDATLVVISFELAGATGGIQRLQGLLPDPLTMTDFADHEPAVAALASHMGPAASPPDAQVASSGGEVICRLMARTVLLAVFRAWFTAGCAPQDWSARVEDAGLDRILSAIHSDLGNDWSIDALASLGAMSRSVFSRRFREQLGASPGQYLTGARMEDAKRRLATGTPVSQVSRELGYASDEGFSRAFRRHTGMPPSQWRGRLDHAAALAS